MDNNNNSGNKTSALLVVAVVGVIGIGAYLVFKAGKGAANSNVYPGTNFPPGTYPNTSGGGVRPPTQYNSGISAGQGGTGAAVGAVGGFLNNLLGLFSKKKGSSSSGGNWGGTVMDSSDPNIWNEEPGGSDDEWGIGYDDDYWLMDSSDESSWDWGGGGSDEQYEDAQDYQDWLNDTNWDDDEFLWS